MIAYMSGIKASNQVIVRTFFQSTGLMTASLQVCPLHIIL